MRKRKAFICIAALITAASLLLCSCDGLPVVELTSESVDADRFINPTTGVEYVACNYAVLPLQAGELYCKLNDSQRYREVRLQDPLEFICDDAEYSKNVYRASTLPDITIDTFNPVGAMLYREGDVSINIGRFNAEKKYLSESLQDLIDSYSEGESPIADDSPYIYAIRDAMTEQEPVEGVYPLTGLVDEDSMVHIQLSSADYPGLLYLVVYYHTINGNDYLFDYGTKESYACPLDVALRIWDFLE